jgi:YebC/PmpR family DNA-binding regulatory protein
LKKKRENIMSGHNKWSSIKHKKGKEDAKRGKIFTKLIRELSIAARLGGADTESNPRLRSAIAAARSANMPKDNISRAIKKGAGGEEGVDLEEITFEGYGPAGVAILIETMTDNRNRTVAEVRHLLDKYNGKMGESGCVAWMFDTKGLVAINKESSDEDTVMEIALDAGADDVSEEGDVFEVLTSFDDFESVREAFEKKEVAYEMAEITRIPQTTVNLEGKEAKRMLKLLDMLEDQDDVQKIHTNFDISEEEMEKLSE